MSDPGSVWQSRIDTPTSTAASEYPGVQVVEIYHEIGSHAEDFTSEQLILIDPDMSSTRVLVRSHVIATGAKAMRSPQYLATIRRREVKRIAEMIRALDKRAESDDFVIWTHEPLERVRRLIQKLTDAEQCSDVEHEGNSCEILRQLRDTFLNVGWKRYREPVVRKAAVEILTRLAVAEEVSSDDAYGAMDQFLDLDLDPSVGMVWQRDEEEAEVSD